MAVGGSSFRMRAASLLHPYVSANNQPQGQQTNISRSATIPLSQHTELPLSEEEDGNEQTSNRAKSGSLSTAGKTLGSSSDDVVTQNRNAQRLVRTIPRK